MASNTSQEAASGAASYNVAKVQLKSLEFRIENARSPDEGLKLAIEAAELALRAIKLAATKTDQAEMKSRADGLLKQAELFKRQTSSPRLEAQILPIRSRTPMYSSSAASREARLESSTGTYASTAVSSLALAAAKAKVPRSRRELTKSEQILLMRGSKLNYCKFPPWGATPNTHDFVLGDGAVQYIDDFEFRLSEAQAKSLDDWKRPNDAIPPPTWFPGDRSLLGPSQECDIANMDLVQDATTDCSVVASMCTGIARAAKGHPHITGDLMYPFDHERTVPVLSPNGKHILKFNFNGCWRRVTIDDRLPVSNTRRVLHVVDRRHPNLLWPALIEKAYLKVRGGYEFPGSNSGTDLWMISGWIPEQIFLQDSDTDLDDIWSCMLKGWEEGNVLITMGTAQISHKAERVEGLASQHDYAVLDLYDDGKHQLIQLKNPWREGRSWTGRISGLEDFDEVDLNGVALDRWKRLKALCDESLPSGTFWIPWNDVQQHFESIYCNWNPGMFNYREDIHFSWDLRTKRGATGSFAHNPQFSVKASGPGEIWLLLSRHFQDASSSTSGDEENISIDNVGLMQGHINLYLYDQYGKRLYISSPPCARGHYVDAPQVLCRGKVDAPKVFTAVVSEQGLPDIRQNFSLSLFSKIPIEVDFAKDPYPNSTEIASSWTRSSAGGRSGSLSFYSNPMFCVQVLKRVSLAMMLTTPASELNVNLKLVHSNGRRIQALNNRDIIVDSGEYRRGSAFAERRSLDPGVYTIICSTFELGQKAPFTLQVDSSEAIVLKQFPAQYAGRIAKRLPSIRFAPGISRLGAQIHPRRHCTFSAAITSSIRTHADSSTPLRLALVLRPGPNEGIKCMSNEGEYNDGRTATVQLPEVNVWPGSAENMWLMVEKMGGGESGEFGVDVLCDGRVDDCVEIGEWRVFEQ